MEMSQRFRGYLPVIIDIETGGFNAQTDAILEIAASTVQFSGKFLKPADTIFFRTDPFEGANVEQSALEFTGIKLNHPLRMAVDEKKALEAINQAVKKEMRKHNCKRAILVGHNAHFDLNFWNAGCERCNIKSAFHPFSTIDTATLGMLAFGQSVLAKACNKAKIDFDSRDAHSARYDTEKTAELFCFIINKWQSMGGLDNIILGSA
jgi:ribonuclease T